MANRAIFDSYSRALSTNEKQATKALKETLEFLAPANEQELRDLLQDLFPALVHQYGRQAATVVCEYYKAEREDAGISEPYEPTLAGDVPYEDLKVMIESALNDVAANTLTSVSQNMLSQQVMNHADRTLVKNIACDPAHPKWALVPHVGACGWCVLLGSQGFVYNSQFTGNNARHDHCTCPICVDFSDAPELEGYDHKAMQEAYSQAYDAVIDDARAKWDDMSAEEKQKYIHKGKKKPSFDVYLRNRVVKEMNSQSTAYQSRKAAQKLLNKAMCIEPKTTAVLKQHESSYSHLTGLEFRLKSEDSLMRKIESDSTRQRVSPELTAKQIHDVIRYTYVCEVDKFGSEFSRIRKDLEEDGYTIVRVRNTLKDTDVQYRGVNTLLKDKDGYVFELQFHTEQSLRVKETNHKLYEEARLLDAKKDAKRRSELEQIMKRNADDIDLPFGIEDVKL
ncbi:MAG: hypothetical protein KIC37_05145 [Coriobacteriaceae bacterium]|nr:hypothetical protein [Coriobacteriaceae bacterium]